MCFFFNPPACNPSSQFQTQVQPRETLHILILFISPIPDLLPNLQEVHDPVPPSQKWLVSICLYSILSPSERGRELEGPAYKRITTNFPVAFILPLSLAIITGLSAHPSVYISTILISTHSSACVECLLWDLNSRNTARKDSEKTV